MRLEDSRCDCGFEVKRINDIPVLAVDYGKKGKSFSDYSHIAPHYDQTRGANNPIHVETAEFMYERYVDSDKVVLDLGAGTGITGFHLAKKGIPYIAGDASAEMLSVFKRAADREGLNNVTFLVMNATAIPLLENSIDLAVTRAVFHHIKDYKRVISEIRRVLRPRGKLLSIETISKSKGTDYITEVWDKYEEILARYGRKVLPTVGPRYEELHAYIESCGGEIAEPEKWLCSNHSADLGSILRILANLALPHLRDSDPETNKKVMAELDSYMKDKYGSDYPSLKTRKEDKQGAYVVSFD
ncbi:class I SAM-dependent methyltransferase [candidate division WOR-3 bacterium]|nr:class I SAM-dependent methyltransferase [candidate division WOR-3 bacterium]